MHSQEAFDSEGMFTMKCAEQRQAFWDCWHYNVLAATNHKIKNVFERSITNRTVVFHQAVQRYKTEPSESKLSSFMQNKNNHSSRSETKLPTCKRGDSSRA